jgi:ribose-phosphate pyrophosphokinase
MSLRSHDPERWRIPLACGGRMKETLLFGGPANPELAGAVSRELGAPLGQCEFERFPDGEISVRLLESVRRREVFLVQSTAPPVNDHLMQLLAFVDACRRSAAARVVAVVPYYGYARADKRHGRREPITASMVATLLQAVGVAQVITVDLHTTQIEGFFDVPVDTLSAVPTLCGALRGTLAPDDVVVSPDAGRVTLATEYAQRLGCDLAVLHKRRISGSETRVSHLVGDVRGRDCLIVDDIISTGGTLVESARALFEAGASAVRVAASHGLLLAGAAQRLRDAGVSGVLVTDSVPAPGREPNVRVVSLAPVLASAIRRFS